MTGEKIGAIFRDLDTLSGCLHEQPAVAGGRFLHVVTDDGHISDSDVLDCARKLDEDSASGVVVRLVGREMVRLLALLTEPQRLMWYLARELEEIGHNPINWAVHVGDGAVERLGTNDLWNAIVTKFGVTVFEGMSVMRMKWESRALDSEVGYAPATEPRNA